MKVRLDELTDRVAYIDPASGKKAGALKRIASRSADIVVAQDAAMRIFVLHAWAGRIPTTAHTDRIFQLVTDWHPRLVGIDASAMQTLYADSLMREARQRGLRLPLDPRPNVTDKDSYIRTLLQPVIADGRLFVQQEHRDLFQELESFPNGMTKDLVDALAHAIEMLPKRAAKLAQHDEREARLKYLKQSGAPSFYIEQVARAS